MWLFLFVVLPLATLSGGLWLLYTAQTLPRRIRGVCFDDIAKIPANRVGLVLGCTRYLRSGRPNLYFAYRITAAAELFRAGKVELLLVSGASHRAGSDSDSNPGADTSEAASMKDALVEEGIPAACVVCDVHGYRTIDSVLRAKRVYGQARLTVISQEFHNQRAIYVADHRGIEAVGFNAQDVALPRAPAVRLREFLARMRVLIDIHVNNTQPRVLGEEILAANLNEPDS
jgi:SanA protein